MLNYIRFLSTTPSFDDQDNTCKLDNVMTENEEGEIKISIVDSLSLALLAKYIIE